MILERSLSEITWNGPLEELTKTSNCQPALYVHGLACLAALRQEMPELAIEAAAGLSLGEWTAHAAAGTFDFATGLKLVEQRGRLMESACEATGRCDGGDDRRDESAVRALAADTGRGRGKPERARPDRDLR
jgi:[acyl-carrier-protein] S-malonyltransferase